MPGKAAKVWITERQQPILIDLSKSRTESQLVVQRATIVLRAFEGQLNAQIAVEIGLGSGQVGVWRRRWQAAWEELTALECREPRRLREAIQEVFRDARRTFSYFDRFLWSSQLGRCVRTVAVLKMYCRSRNCPRLLTISPAPSLRVCCLR